MGRRRVHVAGEFFSGRVVDHPTRGWAVGSLQTAPQRPIAAWPRCDGCSVPEVTLSYGLRRSRGELAGRLYGSAVIRAGVQLTGSTTRLRAPAVTRRDGEAGRAAPADGPPPRNSIGTALPQDPRTNYSLIASDSEVGRSKRFDAVRCAHGFGEPTEASSIWRSRPAPGRRPPRPQFRTIRTQGNTTANSGGLPGKLSRIALGGRVARSGAWRAPGHATRLRPPWKRGEFPGATFPDHQHHERAEPGPG